jgi:glycosyltransferase involved in cell wall biosynthesis
MIKILMNKKFYFIIQTVCFLFVFVSSPLAALSVISEKPPAQPLLKPLKVNVISCKNGKGLETDQDVLAEAIEKLGHTVNTISFEDDLWDFADINIFFQVLIPEKFYYAQLNWFIPNPEWYTHDIQLLEQIDLVLCRTKETERIFQKLKKKTHYLGFTSPDCYQEETVKNYTHFFHLAGESLQKGTIAVQKMWIAGPDLPLLTVVKYPSDFISQQANLQWIPFHIPVKPLRQFQNHCGIHLCPSETEGFGHYIVEGMSTAAVIVTTNAPPMNEIIKDPRCLVPYTHTESKCLATNYYVDPVQLEKKIHQLMSLPPEELRSIGLKNRAIYLHRKKEFYAKLEELLWSTSLNIEK